MRAFERRLERLEQDATEPYTVDVIGDIERDIALIEAGATGDLLRDIRIIEGNDHAVDEGTA